MSAPLRVAVIGVGDFGQQHLAAYERQPDVELVAVADRNVEQAETVAAKWGIPRWFADGSELIEACGPAAVSVVTPGQHHLAPTLTALQHGCAVLLEKPVAISSAEATTIATAAAESTAFVVPAHILRFASPHKAVRDRIADGSIGQLLGISSRRERPRSHERMFPGMHPVMMTMVHDIDLALWLSDSRALRVSAQARRGNDQGLPLLVWAQVEAADGSVWSLRTSWILPDDAAIADRVEVFGTEGAMILSLESPLDYLGPRVPAPNELPADPLKDAMLNEISHFCASARAGIASTVVTLDDAVHGLQIAEAVIMSAEAEGALIDVSSDAAR